MFTRQKVLLAMLKAAERPVQRIELTKWSFLLRNETESGGGAAFFDFVPYHFGPFSFGLNQETEKLSRLGYVDSNSESWKLGNVASPILADRQVLRDLSSIVRQFKATEVESLMDYVYERYPTFTVHSKRKKLAEKRVAPLAIYTSGYEGLSVDAFLNRLVDTGIQRLVDVRMNPIARRYGFHKSTLSGLCSKLGIEYVHIPQLGIHSNLRQELDHQADYDRLFKLYRTTTLAREKEAVEEVSKLVLEKPSVLVCMEQQACCCHRSHLATAISGKTSLDVVHLGQDDCES